MKKRIFYLFAILLLLTAGCTGKTGTAPKVTSPPAGEVLGVQGTGLVLEMEKGFDYIYLMESADGTSTSGEVHLFITDDTETEWGGTAVKYEDTAPRFVRFKLVKEPLELSFSEELGIDDLDSDAPLAPRPQFNPILSPLMVSYLQTQYGISIAELSEWAVTLEDKEGEHPMALSLLGQTTRKGYEALELNIQAGDASPGIRAYASPAEPHLLVEANSREGLEGTSIILTDIQEKEFSIETWREEETGVEAELESQVQELRDELASKEQEIKKLRQEVEKLQQAAVEEEVEPTLEDYVNISVIEYLRYVECTVSSKSDYCAKLDIIVENTGPDAVDFNPLKTGWLEDDKGVQYKVVSAKDTFLYIATSVYPDSKRRGTLYFQPTVPVNVKSLTFFAPVNQQVLNVTIF